jgi:hypothetical protein
MTVRPVFGRTGRVRPIDLIAVFALVSGLVFTAIAMGWIGPSLCESPGPENRPVCNAVHAAIHVEQDVTSSESIAQARSQGLSSEAWVSDGAARFAEYFSGDELARKIAILRQDVESFGRSDAGTGSGGVRNIVVRSIGISGDSATVTAQAEVWWVFVDVIPGYLARAPSTFKTSGSETDYWSFHLTRTGGAWLVDNEQQDRPAPLG